MVPTEAAVKLPPRNPWRSSRHTRAPRRAAASAAPSPAGPPPATHTSTSAMTSAARLGTSTRSGTDPVLQHVNSLKLRAGAADTFFDHERATPGKPGRRKATGLPEGYLPRQPSSRMGAAALRGKRELDRRDHAKDCCRAGRDVHE